MYDIVCMSMKSSKPILIRVILNSESPSNDRAEGVGMKSSRSSGADSEGFLPLHFSVESEDEWGEQKKNYQKEKRMILITLHPTTLS